VKVTKANIIKSVEQATGIKPDLEKYEGSYYWLGKEASLFCDRCVYVSALNSPKASIEVFVKDFKEKIAEIEREYEKPIVEVVAGIDWNIE